MEPETYESVKLTPKGLALCDFVFRDGPTVLGLSDESARVIGELLIKHWDGSETLLEMFRRIKRREGKEEWPEVIADEGEADR